MNTLRLLNPFSYLRSPFRLPDGIGAALERRQSKRWSIAFNRQEWCLEIWAGHFYLVVDRDHPAPSILHDDEAVSPSLVMHR